MWIALEAECKVVTCLAAVYKASNILQKEGWYILDPSKRVSLLAEVKQACEENNIDLSRDNKTYTQTSVIVRQSDVGCFTLVYISFISFLYRALVTDPLDVFVKARPCLRRWMTPADCPEKREILRGDHFCPADDTRIERSAPL